jgi:GTPase SAR1 family protein
MWDTPGQEGYDKLNSSRINESDAYVLFYDLTHRSDLERVYEIVKLICISG